MKKALHFILVLVGIGFVNETYAQETSRFDEQFKSIDNELTSWDPVRGKWLSASLRSMATDQPIPDRTFPEDFAPGEMMRLVPTSTVNNIRVISQANGQNTNDILERERWNRINNYLYRPDCKLIMGRTYGDPHLKSFDGASYSFQTVGEFVLTSANNGQLEVQVRQEPQSDDFSLNTAVAMRVGGDRVGIYADNRRNAGFSSPLLVNGFPVHLEGGTYYLPHGGNIRKSGRNYVVTWPTGEKASVDLRRSGSMEFMNIAVQIYPCATYNYTGLLGNANGSRQDDFNIGRGVSPMFGGEMSERMEKERLAFLAKDFANNFRVQPATSLFDYGFGQNTMTFTDYSYPRVHRTINDLSRDSRTNARNACARAGLTGAELDACIFDQGFLQIPPTPRPVIHDPTTNARLEPVVKEVPNVNPPREIKSPPSDHVNDGDSRTEPNTRPIATPIDQHREDKLDSQEELKKNDRPTWESSEPREVKDQKTENVRPTTPNTGDNNSRQIENKSTPEERPKVESPKPIYKEENKVSNPKPTESKTRPVVVTKPKPSKESTPVSRPSTKENKPVTPPPAAKPSPNKTVTSPRIGGGRGGL